MKWKGKINFELPPLLLGRLLATQVDVGIRVPVRTATASALPANTASGSKVGKTLTADANGALTVDGIAVAADDRVLVKSESTGADNGVYDVTQPGTAGTPYILTRATDFDEDVEVFGALLVPVSEGSANQDSVWKLTTNDPITVDTTSLSFTELGAAGAPDCYQATATGDTQTTSASDVLVDSMSITPAAGDYLVEFSSAVEHGTNNASVWMSIYVGGSQIAHSERRFTRGGGQGNVTDPFHCQARVNANGSQAIEAKWRTSTGTATMHQRNIVASEVNPV